MCEFISWIEKDGRILFLTDKEIFSSQGKERLEGCQDNDFLGHGAIRRFFAPCSEKMFRGGEEKEQEDFWNTITLPKQIAELLKTPKDFEKHWGKTFENYFQNDDLRHIIGYAPEPYKGKAWEQLLKQSLGNSDLHHIIGYAPEPYKGKAWEQLLKQNPDNDDLRRIIENAPEPYKEKAAEQLLKKKPYNDDLCCIIEYAPEPYKSRARKILNQKR